MTSDPEPPSISNPDLAEEITSINAIYDPSTISLTTTSSSSTSASPDTTLLLRLPTHPSLSFLLAFPPTYPSAPPTVLSTASTNSRGSGKKYLNALRDVVNRVCTEGCVCLFDVIEECEGAFGDLTAENGDAAGEEGLDRGAGVIKDGDSSNITKDDDAPPQSLHASFGLDSPPDWILSEPITEKKSLFVARAARVQSKDVAERYLDYLLAAEKKVAVATHNISAWRIRQRAGVGEGLSASGGETMVFQDFDDDGETAAGGRLLHLMQLMDVWDVVVVVSRWYGGVKLGPDRFRLINSAARDALIRGGFTKGDGGNGGQEKGGKKKGKR
ncbi:hypothetical protein AJ79_08930 [Helicocarpus griseus UAMH5409]|uniref:RWD domain-containing protein n=1 Tax=Helicocarpus griseus UAMH5409 TaxID=1447875 RepID=A0A2B7WNZ3_9EURO|nr:hypothetical protein AJ79_08930 [Helicocarpus griseus UAMH5409]